MSEPVHETTLRYSADEFVSFELPSTLVKTSEELTGRLRFVHNASHLGRPYRLQQEWLVVERRHEKTADVHMACGRREWRDVPCVEEGADG